MGKEDLFMVRALFVGGLVLLSSCSWSTRYEIVGMRMSFWGRAPITYLDYQLKNVRAVSSPDQLSVSHEPGSVEYEIAHSGVVDLSYDIRFAEITYDERVWPHEDSTSRQIRQDIEASDRRLFGRIRERSRHSYMEDWDAKATSRLHTDWAHYSKTLQEPETASGYVFIAATEPTLATDHIPRFQVDVVAHFGGGGEAHLDTVQLMAWSKAKVDVGELLAKAEIVSAPRRVTFHLREGLSARDDDWDWRGRED